MPAKPPKPKRRDEKAHRKGLIPDDASHNESDNYDQNQAGASKAQVEKLLAEFESENEDEFLEKKMKRTKIINLFLQLPGEDAGEIVRGFHAQFFDVDQEKYDEDGDVKLAASRDQEATN